MGQLATLIQEDIIMQYPIKFNQEKKGAPISVSFPDFPEAFSQGADERDALKEAAACLETIVMMYINDKSPLPWPSREGDAFVSMPVLKSAKLKLMLVMQKQNIRKVDLCRRLEVSPAQIDRLLDLNHSTKIEFVEKALHCLGSELILCLRSF